MEEVDEKGKIDEFSEFFEGIDAKVRMRGGEYCDFELVILGY